MGSPLVAFALVAEEYEKSGDPIKGLKPLFAPILADQVGKKFVPEIFAQRFKEAYGLDMTPFVANALAERLVEIELLVPVHAGRPTDGYMVGDFQWVPENIDENLIDQTVKIFSRWAKRKLEPTGRVVADQLLEEAILLRLARPEFASIFLDEDAGKKNARLKGQLGIGAIDPSVKENIYLDYLVADFVLTAAESAPQVFKAISQIAYGSLVADAVAGLAVPGKLLHPDPPLRVVFDGPLILDLLDLNTSEHKGYAEGLLEMVNAAGLMIAVFDHSVEEMRATIRATLVARQRSVGFGPMAERFRTESGHVLYATAVADTLDARVKALGFTILRSQYYEEARYKKFFPEERVDQVRNWIGDLHEHVEARMRDAMSVATVARLKGEKRAADSIFDSGTIFITRNSVLAKRVIKALSVGRADPDPRFVIATDGQLAGVLRFVSGITGIDLSRRRLIANCSSAVLPKPEVVSRIAKVLNGLNERLSEEFTALMTDKRASLCPMRLTTGMVDLIDEAKSLEILETMKQELVAPVVERAELAEARASLSEAEVEKTSADSKEAVLVLQDLIVNKDTVHSAEKIGFDQQLAQLEFDLSAANEKLRASDIQGSKKKKDYSSKVVAAEEALLLRERKAGKIIYAVFSAIAITASVVSILLPDLNSSSLKLILALVYLASIKWVGKFLKKISNKVVATTYAGDRKYVKGLKEAEDIL